MSELGPVQEDDAERSLCPLCSTESRVAGRKQGRRIQREFTVRQCPACRFAFVANPCTDFDQIYSEAYYQGRGSDPMVDYLFELEHPDLTIRQFEWEGIAEIINRLRPLNSNTRWLDFGCGNGGLVRYCRKTVGCEAWGFEEGWITQRAEEKGIPLLPRPQLADQRGRFDVITAIEVIEHTIQPLEFLAEVRTLLKPGGLLFVTTGNAAPYSRNVCRWPYVLPEIHNSFFEPTNLGQAMQKSGFRCEYPRFGPGWEKVIKFKLLKNLGFRQTAWWMNLIPWGATARLCDARFKITAHPIGWAV